MTTRIGLLSDVHATPAPVQEALSIFADAGTDLIICAGDTAGYADELTETVSLLEAGACVSILGNHDIEYLRETAASAYEPAAEYLRRLPMYFETVIGGTSVYAVHARPPAADRHGIKLLDEDGALMPERVREWTDFLDGFAHDVLVVGHTHQVFAERLGDTLVVNPGSTKFNHTCAILTLPSMEVEFFSLSGKEPIRSWNWGMLVNGT